MSKEGELEGTIVYWERKNSLFVDQIIMKASANPELNHITIMEAKMNAYSESEIDYESYKGTYKLE